MSCCKNCGLDFTPLNGRAFVRLNAQINALKKLLHELEIKQQSQKQGFCDELCEQRYHGDA